MKNIIIHIKYYKNDEILTENKLIAYKTSNIIIHIYEKTWIISKNIQVTHKILEDIVYMHVKSHKHLQIIGKKR